MEEKVKALFQSKEILEQQTFWHRGKEEVSSIFQATHASRKANDWNFFKTLQTEDLTKQKDKN